MNFNNNILKYKLYSNLKYINKYYYHQHNKNIKYNNKNKYIRYLPNSIKSKYFDNILKTTTLSPTIKPSNAMTNYCNNGIIELNIGGIVFITKVYLYYILLL